MRTIILVMVLAIWILPSCIEPFTPNLENTRRIMVVEGFITDENRTYTVKLSYTFQKLDVASEKISGATVTIQDMDGPDFILKEKRNGVYSSDSLLHQGIVGHRYLLYIKTRTGEIYNSDTCFMYPVPDIDSVYYKYATQVSENSSSIEEGISFYIDTKAPADNEAYYRWTFEEDWMFEIPFPKQIIVVDDSLIADLPEIKNKQCWKHNNSGSINVFSKAEQNSETIKAHQIHFVDPLATDRFGSKYSLLVKQHSISEEEYLFWSDLKSSNQTSGDLFEKQAYAIRTNIRNLNDASEPVIGIFQVSAVKSKRIYITAGQVRSQGIYRFYKPFVNCEAVDSATTEYPDVISYFENLGLELVAPMYDVSGLSIIGLRFASRPCSDCSVWGNPKKPSFWQD